MKKMLSMAGAIVALAFTAAACSQPAPPTPPPSPTTAPEVVNFLEGTTSASVTSELAAAGAQAYTVDVPQGELFMVNVNTATAEAALEVLQDGKPVTGISSGPMFWGGYAPVAGSYTLRVKGPAKTAYAIEVRRPRRVLFDKGADLTTMSGTAMGQTELDYVVHAHPGQKLVFELQSPAAAPYISVVRASDGKVLLDHASQADIFETKVDADSEYIVAVVAGPVDTEFKLLVRLGK